MLKGSQEAASTINKALAQAMLTRDPKDQMKVLEELHKQEVKLLEAIAKELPALRKQFGIGPGI